MKNNNDTSASKATSKNTSMEWLLEELRLLKAGANIDTDVDIQQTHTTIRSHLLADVMGVIGDNEIGNIGYVGEEMVDETTEEMFYRNQLRVELRTAFNELLGDSDEE